MKPALSQKANKFRRKISPVREIMSFAADEYLKNLGIIPGELISFAGGWVNHETPESFRDAYKHIINDDRLFHLSGGYSPTLGSISTKKAIIKFESALYGINELDESQIAIGQSSTQLAINLFEVLLDADDKILLLDPSYCNYPTQIISSLQNIELLRYPILNAENWKYESEERINDFINYILDKKPKVVLLIVPDNPTSQILSDNFILQVLNAVQEIGSFLVIDFAYKEIFFMDKYPEYYSWGPNENFIQLHSNSKWCRSLGRRLGWVDASADVIESLESIMNSSILCPDTLHQMAFAEYVNESVEKGTLINYIKETSDKYKQASELTIQSINEYIGLPCLVPEGGLYTCMRVKSNSAEFVERILKSTSVLFVPGWGFGRTLFDAVRISFGPLVNDHEKIVEGLKRVGNLLKGKS